MTVPHLNAMARSQVIDANGPSAAPGGKRKAVPAGEMARLYRLGLTMPEIAAVYGVSAWTVAARLDQAGVPRRRASNRRTVLPVERAVRRYRKQPHRLGELAAELGISAQLIIDRAAQPGRRVPGRPRDRANVPAREVADLYRAGWTVSQIAAKYQVAASTVLHRLDAAGVARRPKSTPVPFPVEEAARRVRQDGTSLAQLARDYQVGVESVRGQLRALGIHAPPCTGPRVLRDVPAAEIAGLHTSGLTIAAIADRYGVSPGTISVRLRAACVTTGRLGRHLRPAAAGVPAASQVPAQEAAARYRQGAALTKLAAAYQVSARTMRRELVAVGVSIRPPGGVRIPIPVDEAAQLYAAGQTMRRIAARYGVCETVIYDRLTKADIPLRRKTDRKEVDPGLLAHLAGQIGLDAAR
jgi:lambda repressor-like predicted transcriptional regulator